MNPEVSRLALLGVLTGGALAWLLALRSYLQLRQPNSGGSEEPCWSLRIKLVKGDSAALYEGLLRVFESASRDSEAPPLIVKRNGDGPLLVTSHGQPGFASVPAFSHCRAEVRATDPASPEIEFRTDYAAVRGRALRAVRICLVAGLALLLGNSLLLWIAIAHHHKVAGIAGPLLCALFASLAASFVICSLYRKACRQTDIFLDSAAAHASALAEAFATKSRKAVGPDQLKS